MKPLRNGIGAASNRAGRFLHGPKGSIFLDELVRGSSLGDRLPELSGRSVLLQTSDPLATALAVIELDGVARRLTICPPDLAPEHLARVVASADVDAIVSDRESRHEALGGYLHVACSSTILSREPITVEHRPTEWVLLTSGTTGAPKMLVHTLAGLVATVKPSESQTDPIVWGCLYPIHRFAGLQVVLQAMLGGGSLVLSSTDEPLGGYLARLGAHGATHISGTPSQWRRVLMSPAAHMLAPRQITLGGEVADQAILDSLGSFYPRARLTHIYASTEAGVGFAVNDGLEGFPANMVGGSDSGLELKIENGSLRIRSSRLASSYLGAAAPAMTDKQGFVDTGDMVELRGERYHFLGRREGTINVGGLKVHPEEVEAAINRHPAVRMSSVRSRKNAITGSIVVADVVLKAEPNGGTASSALAALREEILRICRGVLSQHKVPAAIQFVPDLDVVTTGKLTRHAVKSS